MTAENPMHPVSMQGGNQALENELNKKGFKFHKIKGKYGGNPENSYLIENPDHDAIIDLGKKLGQDSVIVSKNGQHKMVYTNGPDTGKHHLGNSIETFDNPPEDYYSTGVDNGKPFHFSINFDMDTKHQDEMKKSQLPQYLVHFSTTPGLKELDPMMQGSAGRHSPETKHGRPEHPRVYFYEENTPTESVVTGGAKSKYIVKHPGSDKIYDIAKDPHGLQQQAKEQWLQKPIGSMQDAYFKLLKDKGYMGFKNSSSGLPNVVALFHKTPVHAEVPAPADMSANKDWTEATVPMSLKKSSDMKKAADSQVKEAVEKIKGPARVNEVLAESPVDKRHKILAYLRKEKLEKMNGAGVSGAGGATPPMMQPPVPAAPAMTGLAKADESESKMAKKDLKDIMEYAQALDGMVVETEDLEDWVDSKIAVARQYLSDIAHYLSYEHGQPTEELDKADIKQNPMATDSHIKNVMTAKPNLPKLKQNPMASAPHVKNIMTAKPNPSQLKQNPMAKSDSKKAKFERCVMAVKKKSGDKVNPWAVCHASVDGKMEKASPLSAQDVDRLVNEDPRKSSMYLDKHPAFNKKHIDAIVAQAPEHAAAFLHEHPQFSQEHVNHIVAKAPHAAAQHLAQHPLLTDEHKMQIAKVAPQAAGKFLKEHPLAKAEMSVKEQEKPTKGMPQAKQLKADADLEKVKEGAENVAKAADKKKSELNKSTGYFKQNPKKPLPEWHDPLQQQRESAAKEEAEVRPTEKAHIWAMLEREHQMSQKSKAQKPKEELEKGDVVSMKDRKVISTDTKAAPKEMVSQQSKMAANKLNQQVLQERHTGQASNSETHESMMANAKSLGLNEPISNYEWAKLMNESQNFNNPDFNSLLKKIRTQGKGPKPSLVKSEELEKAKAKPPIGTPERKEFDTLVQQVKGRDKAKAEAAAKELKSKKYEYHENEILRLKQPTKKQKEIIKKIKERREKAVYGRNYKRQQKEVWGTYSNPKSREKEMKMVGDFAKKTFGLDLEQIPQDAYYNSLKDELSGISKNRDKMIENGKWTDKHEKEHKEHQQNIKNRMDTYVQGLAERGVNIEDVLGKKTKAGIYVNKPGFSNPRNNIQHTGTTDSAIHELAHLIFHGALKSDRDKERSSVQGPLPHFQQGFQKQLDEILGDIQRKYNQEDEGGEGYGKQWQTAHEYIPLAIEQLIRRHLGLPAHQKKVAEQKVDGVNVLKPEKQFAVDVPNKQIVHVVKNKAGKDVYLTGKTANITPDIKQKFEQIVDKKELKYNPTEGFVQGTSPDAKINIRAREAAKDKSRKDADTLMRSEELEKKLIPGEGKPSKATKKATPEKHKEIMDRLSAALDTMKVDPSPEASEERKMLLEHVKSKLKGQK